MTETEVTISSNNNHLTSGGDTEIDLYADVVETELANEAAFDYSNVDSNEHQENDLYGHVITTQPSIDSSDSINVFHDNSNKQDSTNGSSSTGGSISSNSYGNKRISYYVSQLTWWTTDADLIEAIRDIGVNDLLEVKFHENRVNGQSKGFAVVTVGSEASSRLISENLPKRKIHDQNARILPCNKQSLSLLEGPTRKDSPMESMPLMGGAPLAHMMGQPMGLQLPMPRPGSMEQSYRFHPQVPVLLTGGPGGMNRPPMAMGMVPRVPVAGAPLVISRMPGPAPPGSHLSHGSMNMSGSPRPGVGGVANAPHMVRQPVRPGGQVIPGQHSSTSYPGQTVNSPGIPPYGHPMMNPSHPDPYYRMADTRHESNTTTATNENDFPEILEQNKTISSSAINSAVHYASQGDSGRAVETLVTAISLIKQSKIGQDQRCQMLITSLHDTLKGIEDQIYGSRNRSRSRSRSREPLRKKHRHRSRSPHDRSERRRRDDYDDKYSREHRRC